MFFSISLYMYFFPFKLSLVLFHFLIHVFFPFQTKSFSFPFPYTCSCHRQRWYLKRRFLNSIIVMIEKTTWTHMFSYHYLKILFNITIFTAFVIYFGSKRIAHDLLCDNIITERCALRITFSNIVAFLECSSELCFVILWCVTNENTDVYL